MAFDDAILAMDLPGLTDMVMLCDDKCDVCLMRTPLNHQMTRGIFVPITSDSEIPLRNLGQVPDLTSALFQSYIYCQQLPGVDPSNQLELIPRLRSIGFSELQ